MKSILQDLVICQNGRNYASMVYTGSCRISTITRMTETTPAPEPSQQIQTRDPYSQLRGDLLNLVWDGVLCLTTATEGIYPISQTRLRRSQLTLTGCIETPCGACSFDGHAGVGSGSLGTSVGFIGRLYSMMHDQYSKCSHRASVMLGLS